MSFARRLVVLLPLLAACESGPAAEAPDATTDAGATDAGATDAGATDAGATDAQDEADTLALADRPAVIDASAPSDAADAPASVDAPTLTDTAAPRDAAPVADAPTVMDAARADVAAMDAPAMDAARADVAAMDATAVDAARADVTATDTGGMVSPSCAPAAGGGSATVARPTLARTLADRYQEAWLASPAVEDLDRDGTPDIIAARDGRLVVWRPDGTVRWAVDVARARIWASPVVANFVGDANLEIAVAAGAQVFLYNAAGALAPGFPVAWRDEVRALAGADLDGDGRPELAAVTTTAANPTGGRDLLQVFRADGSVLPGFPPNRSGASMCDTACDLAGGYDQNLALGPLDADARWDVWAPHDNAYMSWHHATGEAFRAVAGYRGVTRVPGVRFLHDEAFARMGYAPDERTALQAHFTNSAPAIADLDGDGVRELIVLASVQNAAQTNRRLGVALWVLHHDASRAAGWSTPFHVPGYLAGLEDLGGNIVAATNQVSVADLDPTVPGLDVVFAGFDGRIHCVSAARAERWSYAYTTAANVLTGGVAIADLSGDGRPEVIFATYSTANDVSALYVLDARGALLHRVALPGRGAMAVPTVADVDRDGALDLVVSLKDAVDRVRSVLVYRVAGASPNCMPWPTGRANALRNGYRP